MKKKKKYKRKRKGGKMKDEKNDFGVEGKTNLKKKQISG